MAKLLTETEFNQLQEVLNDAARLAVEIAGHKKATIDELLQMVRDLKADRERLEWAALNNCQWSKSLKTLWYGMNNFEYGEVRRAIEAETMREAIDWARNHD